MSRIDRRKAPLLATIAVCALLYGIAAWRYEGFATATVFVNFFADNAFLGIAAVGMTFVILSGGIDLSVGAMVGLTSILVAVLVENCHMSPIIVIPLVLMIGTLIGAGMGALIRYYAMPPFLVTLAGMFFARGMAYVISVESISLTHPYYVAMSEVRLPLFAGISLPLTAIIFIVVVLAGVYLSQFTRFGRNVYALGGNEDAANLMGLPIGPTKMQVYALSGFCSALAGIVYTIYSSSGGPNNGVGLELDAIAATVVGGTPLTGGVGYVQGTMIGVLIFGIIQTGIMFQGTLSSWWTKMAVGILLLVFILLQKLLARTSAR